MDETVVASDVEYRLPAAYSQGFAHVRVLVGSKREFDGDMGMDPIALEGVVAKPATDAVAVARSVTRPLQAKAISEI